MSYKVKILNGVIKLKTLADNILNVLGIKDLGTQTGVVTDGLIDWSLQMYTQTTAQWNASTYILKKGQAGIEDTGTTTYKMKVGDGVSTWSQLGYISGGGGGSQNLQSVTDIGSTTTNAINTAGNISDYFQLDTTATNTNAVAKIVWNDSLGTGEIGLKGGSINAKLAQDLYARVVNKTGADLLYSQSKVVKVQSAQGQRLAVNLAQANNDLNSADTIGLVAENIGNNQEGFVITVGQLTGLNTTGSLQGETWSDGDVLYLSPTVAGNITNLKPTGSTGHIVILGYVEYSHQNNGKIYVKIMNGWELSELHDTFINPSTLANNDALIYESSTQLWKNKTIAQALGYTPPQFNSVYFQLGNIGATTFSPADATTYYYGMLTSSTNTATNNQARSVIMPVNTTVTDVSVSCWVNSTIGSNEAIELYLEEITPVGVLVKSTLLTNSFLMSSANRQNNAVINGLNFLISSGNCLTIKMVCPTWVTNPTNMWITFMINAKL